MATTQSYPKPLRVRFSTFEVNFVSRELFKAGTRIKIQKQPLEILCLLLEQSGEVVSREQLRERLWPRNTFVEYEDSLNTAVRKLRSALSDSHNLPRYIETVAREGYRFIAPVQALSFSTAAALATDVETDPRADLPHPIHPAPSKPRWRTNTRAVLSVTLAVLATAVGGWIVWSRSRTLPSVPGKVMLAVLPFQNLTGDTTEDYFSDGLTEEMISRLGSLDPQRLGVIARTSVMHYKNSQTPLDKIGRELGVHYVIEGSVRRDSNDVRVTAQLIQTKDQMHVWAHEYNRELKGLLMLQDEIAQEIADEIQIALGDHKSVNAAQPTLSPREYEAYDLYLKGQYFFNKRTVAALEEAIRYFEQAIAKDPNYARAYTGLADSYALLAGYSSRPPEEYISKARVAVLKAVEIDKNLPEAHTALALIVQNHDWDWETAEKEFRRAIDLNPNYATAHHWYAEHLMWRGRFDEALHESERARQLDPLSLIIGADNGAILYFSRQYDQAIEKWRSVLEMDPYFVRAHTIAAAYVEKGMFEEALADTERMRPMVPAPAYWSMLAYIYGRAGRTAQARHALHELLESNQHHPIDPRIIAWAYVGLGDKDQAFAWLEKACASHSNELVTLKVNPAYDVLRSDARFEHLVRRVGLGN